MEAAGLNYYSVGRADMIGEGGTAVRKPITAEIEIQTSLTNGSEQPAPVADAVNEDRAA
jgi:hypothetical protein